ncbi:MAG: aldehyde ferredoxin oxidoreductase N-terminal domain-containing protein [Desulfobacterales bacterium]
MISDYFRVLKINLADGKGQVVHMDGRDRYIGGSGLGAHLFAKFGFAERPWDDAEQPLIFAIGSLTGLFPLMSKTVCAFKSPYHNQFAESHAGGRSALCMRFAGIDALVIVGKAPHPVCLSVGSRHIQLKNAGFLWGVDIQNAGKALRRMSSGSGHRSILRIGAAGENMVGTACINVDTYRHFGRLGAGAVMGSKKLKAIIIEGDASFDLPSGKQYKKLFNEVYKKVTDAGMMHKYHDLGTAENVTVLNALSALPIRNLQKTSGPAFENLSGEQFADRTLLRNMACSGCPVGCIHVGFVREKFMEPNHYLYRQVAYDFEPIFAIGCMLEIEDPFEFLALLDVVEKTGLDAMSAGVALAWASEAFEKKIISEKHTLIPIRFGQGQHYRMALEYMARGENEFYRALGKGVEKATAKFGGNDFACVLGQEMAGYATGETFFVSQALGFRHSHLDTGGYSFDQKKEVEGLKDVEKAVAFLVEDEKERVLLTSLVACLFARKVYTPDLVSECLGLVGIASSADKRNETGENIQKLRWKTRIATGYDPLSIRIPKRFYEIENWKGRIDKKFMEALRVKYAEKIVEMGS